MNTPIDHVRIAAFSVNVANDDLRKVREDTEASLGEHVDAIDDLVDASTHLATLALDSLPPSGVAIPIAASSYADDDCTVLACVDRAKARVAGIATMYDEDCEHDIISDVLHYMTEKYGHEEAMVNLDSAIRNFQDEREDLLYRRAHS